MRIGALECRGFPRYSSPPGVTGKTTLDFEFFSLHPGAAFPLGDSFVIICDTNLYKY